jgi:hypothetical protein
MFNIPYKNNNLVFSISYLKRQGEKIVPIPKEKERKMCLEV